MVDLLLKHLVGDWASGRGELAGSVLDESDVGWLTGVRDASDELRAEADDLLAAIKKHGRIEFGVEH